MAHLRTNVPEELLNKFQDKLESCRPGLQANCNAVEHPGEAETAPSDTVLSPAPAQLQSKFAAVTIGIPSLR